MTSWSGAMGWLPPTTSSCSTSPALVSAYNITQQLAGGAGLAALCLLACPQHQCSACTRHGQEWWPRNQLQTASQGGLHMLPV